MLYRLQNILYRPAAAPPVAARHAPPHRTTPTRGGIFASPLNPSSIIHVDPRTLQLKNTAAPSLKTENKVYAKKRISLAPALAAGSAVLLAPALAFAGDLSGTLFGVLGNVGVVGYFCIFAGVALTVRYLWKTYKTLKPENYQSPNSILNTNNPTLRKHLKTLIAPAFALSLWSGMLMNYLPLYLDPVLGPALKQVIGIPSVGWALLLGFTALVAANIAIASIRDISRWIHFKWTGIQRNVVQPKQRPQLFTSFFGNAGWFAQVVLMAHFSSIVTQQFTGLLFNFTSQVCKLAAGGADYIALGEWGLLFASINIALQLLFRARKNRVGRPLEQHPSPLKIALKAALIGAVAGAVIYCAGAGLLASNLLVFAVALSFAHGALHSTRSQIQALRQKDKVFPIFDKQSTWEAVRSANGAFRTVYKPSVDMVDPLISSDVMVLITEGANWVLNAISGCYTAADYEKAQLMIERLLNKDAKGMRIILQEGNRALQAANNPREAYEAVAVAFEKTAAFLDAAAPGNLRERSGLDFLKDGVYSSGLPGSRLRRSDQDLRVHGEHIRMAARIYTEMAGKLRLEGAAHGNNLDLDSLKEDLFWKLEAYHRRAKPHCDTHPGRFYTNFLPDSYNAKQFVIDLCSQVMSDFVGGMEVGVLNQRGQIEIWLVPMKAVKDVDPEYRKARTLEDKTDDLEDSRFSWYVRDDHDLSVNIPNNLCEIAYIDNSAHFSRHGRDRSQYPTAEVVTPPELAKHEYYDIVYKNKARLRIYGDGRQKVFGDLPPNAAALLSLPGTRRHAHVAEMIRCGANDTVLYGIPVSDQNLSRLIRGDVPHPFGGSMTTEKYKTLRWRFMYPTEFTSVSDADQMDRAVTNLRLFHLRSDPHLRVMYSRTKEEKLPFDPSLLENPGFDSFLEAGIALSWMMLKVKLQDGRELYMPLNMNKENERTFGGELWRYIDETRPVEIAEKRSGPYLKLPYRLKAYVDPAFKRARAAIEEVPMPIELLDLKDQIEAIRIDPVRFGETGGPIPVVDYLFVRRNTRGEVIDRSGNKTLSDRVTQLLIFGSSALLSQKEMEHMCLVLGDERARTSFPWTDEQGVVHLKISRSEYDQLKPWIPVNHAENQLDYSAEREELLIDVHYFAQLCEAAYPEFTYRRYIPDSRYRNYFERSETW
jgi:hypothetical protein